MVVGVKRRQDGTRAQLTAQREQVVEFLLPLGTLEAGPAQVGAARKAIDFLPRLPADITGPRLVGRGMQGKSVRVTNAVGPNLRAVRVGTVVERIVGRRRSVIVDSEDLAAQAIQVLRPERIGIGERLAGAVAIAQEQRAIRAVSQAPIALMPSSAGMQSAVTG